MKFSCTAFANVKCYSKLGNLAVSCKVKYTVTYVLVQYHSIFFFFANVKCYSNFGNLAVSCKAKYTVTCVLVQYHSITYVHSISQ